MTSTVFDELTLTLSSEERQKILEQITSSTEYSQFTVLTTPEENYHAELAPEKVGLSFFQRLRLRLYSFFAQEPYEEVLKNFLLNKLKKATAASCADLVDFQKKLYLPGMFEQLTELSEVFLVFKRPLNDALIEHRSEFYAFLGGIEAPYLQEELLNITRPEMVAKENPSLNTAELRTLIETKINELLQKIIAQSKSAAKSHARSLAHLERLVTFNFEKTLTVFAKDGTCKASLLNKSLKKLNDILSAFTTPPKAVLLEHLFLFSYKCQNVNNSDLVSSLEADLKKATEAIKFLQAFKQIPLTKILRILNDDYFYEVTKLSGGEDWVNLYQKFWIKRGDQTLKYFIFTTKQKAVHGAILALLDRDDLPKFKYYSSEKWPRSLKPYYEISFGFTAYFFTKFFLPARETILVPLQQEAIFFKKDNKRDFIELLELIDKNYKNFVLLTKRMAPEGDLYTEDKGITTTNEIEISQQTTAATTNRLIGTLVQNCVDSFRVLALVLDGINNGLTLNGRYDSISNMQEFTSRDYNFAENLKNFFVATSDFSAILIDCKDIEDRLLRLETTSTNLI